MRAFIHRYRLLFSLLFMCGGLAFSSYMSRLIGVYFPDRQPIFDTLFSWLPYWSWLQYWTDIAFLFSIALLAWAFIPEHMKRLPFIFTVIGLAYFIRGFFVFMNPFGGPLGNIAEYGLTTVHQFGQFPSGHTLFVVLVYLLLDARDTPHLKQWALVSVVVEIVSLLLSHGHYSIDIAGGFLVAYFAYHVLKPIEYRLVN
jgi:membrane-associated phospholipid phosphatase